MAMTGSVVAIWLATVALDTAGQLAFKYVASHPQGSGMARWQHMARQPQLWFGVACYVFEFLAWTAFLSLVPLGRGVLLGSINIVAIMLAGRWLFGERLGRMQVAGICLVSAGVAVVGLGS
ncbi:EamA family transporter [Xanthomonas sp. A2111]|uniref:EamA family transporter n=1 Tax=Xanthomonas hawaiiensis TaxID=3003247 RepID=A0ABU2I020_9XANT|nr:MULTISPECIES: EamA family transporter [unclassified Xanthomonas]MBO9827980.1 EamA family transporter [Xanthomonas sp. A2111]MBO9875831.1 EamA family transporter [Xanthomonas sp. D-93]MDS9991506.1 EamA family transporter [Xanthomonas sp. A2111]WNH43330.1 EamA family transporter [Xanthomonas sp. A6251]